MLNTNDIKQKNEELKRKLDSASETMDRFTSKLDQFEKCFLKHRIFPGFFCRKFGPEKQRQEYEAAALVLKTEPARTTEEEYLDLNAKRQALCFKFHGNISKAIAIGELHNHDPIRLLLKGPYPHLRDAQNAQSQLYSKCMSLKPSNS